MGLDEATNISDEITDMRNVDKLNNRWW
jgi:hypothetical protein